METPSDPESYLGQVVLSTLMVHYLASSQWWTPATCHYLPQLHGYHLAQATGKSLCQWQKPRFGPFLLCLTLQHEPDNIFALGQWDIQLAPHLQEWFFLLSSYPLLVLGLGASLSHFFWEDFGDTLFPLLSPTYWWHYNIHFYRSKTFPLNQNSMVAPLSSLLSWAQLLASSSGPKGTVLERLPKVSHYYKFAWSHPKGPYLKDLVPRRSLLNMMKILKVGCSR